MAIVTVDVVVRLKRIVVPVAVVRLPRPLEPLRRSPRREALRCVLAETAVGRGPTANDDGENASPLMIGGVRCDAPGDCGASGSATTWIEVMPVALRPVGSVTVSAAWCRPGVAKACVTTGPTAVPPSSNDHA